MNDTIVGGTGAYRGATGTLVPHFSGTTLAGPNAYRVPFNIAPQALRSGVILNREPCERHVADNPAYIALSTRSRSLSGPGSRYCRCPSDKESEDRASVMAAASGRLALVL